MTLAERLRAAGDAGDEAAVRALLADLSEAERADLIPLARQLVAARTKMGINAAGPLAPMLLLAYGVLSVSEIRKLGWRSHHVPDRLHDVLRRRGPERLLPIIDFLLDDVGGWRAWREVRPLIREGIAPRPDRPSYTLALLAASPYRDAAGLQADDPGLLEVEVWRLFEVEGGGETSLATTRSTPAIDGATCSANSRPAIRPCGSDC
jgi:hypothetical protein